MASKTGTNVLFSPKKLKQSPEALALMNGGLITKENFEYKISYQSFLDYLMDHGLEWWQMLLMEKRKHQLQVPQPHYKEKK